MSDLPPCPQCGSTLTYEDASMLVCPECAHEWAPGAAAEENEAEAARIVSSAFIAVFDDYCTGGPGWFGKLMVMVWDGSPSQYEVYVWEHGKLVRQKQALE